MRTLFDRQDVVRHVSGKPGPRYPAAPNPLPLYLLELVVTAKWNKVEHRLFSAITSNWRGRPLTSQEVVVDLIAAITTRTGLKVHAERDHTYYPTGVKVTDAQLAAVPLTGHQFHPEWNYTIGPGPKNPTPVTTR